MKHKRVKRGGRLDWWVIALGVGVFVLVLIVFQVAQKALGDENDRGNKDDNNDSNNNNSNRGKSWGSWNYADKVVTIAPTLSPTVKPTTQPTAELTETINFQTQSQFLAGPTAEPIPLPTDEPTAVPTAYPTPQPSAPLMKQPEIKSDLVSGNATISTPGILVITPKSGALIQTIKVGIQSIGRGEIVTPSVTPSLSPTPPKTLKETELILNTITLKYQLQGGQLALVGEDEQGTAMAIDEADMRRTETSVLNRLERRGVILSLTSDNKLAVRNNNVTAVTDLPIMVDVKTKTLMVSTPDGPMAVTVLPDKALENILDLGVIASVNTQVIPKIEYMGDEVVYRFGGTKVYKMLGIYNVTVPVTIVVSANTGEVVSRDQPFITRVVRLISI